MILCKVIRNTWASITYYFFQGCFLCLFLISLDTFLINKLFLQTVSQEPYWNCRHWELFHVVLIDIYKTECPINGILFCFITYVDTCPYKDRLYLSAKYRFWRSNTSLFFVNFVFPHFFCIDLALYEQPMAFGSQCSCVDVCHYRSECIFQLLPALLQTTTELSVDIYILYFPGHFHQTKKTIAVKDFLIFISLYEKKYINLSPDYHVSILY